MCETETYWWSLKRNKQSTPCSWEGQFCTTKRTCLMTTMMHRNFLILWLAMRRDTMKPPLCSASLCAIGHSFLVKKEHTMRLISGFRGSVNDICALLLLYVALIGSVLPTFREELLVWFSRVKQSDLEDGPLLGLLDPWKCDRQLAPKRQ